MLEHEAVSDLSQVNNAGIRFDKNTQDLWETNMDEFDKVNAVNFRGVFLGMKHASRCGGFPTCRRHVLLSSRRFGTRCFGRCG